MALSFEGHAPQLGRDVFIAEGATVLGQVHLDEAASVWYGCVLRGDVGAIRIGARSNIQDATVVHVTGGKFDTSVSHDVTVGHRAILHGCTVDDHVLVGMGAILLDGVRVGPYCIVGAGTLLPPGKAYPPRSLIMGAPGKVVREVTAEEMQHIDRSAGHYVELAARHRAGLSR